MLTATALPLPSAHLALSLQHATKRCVCLGWMMIQQSKDSKKFCNSLNFNENFIDWGVRCAKLCSPGRRLTAVVLCFFKGKSNVWVLYLSPNQFLIVLVCNICSSRRNCWKVSRTLGCGNDGSGESSDREVSKSALITFPDIINSWASFRVFYWWTVLAFNSQNRF